MTRIGLSVSNEAHRALLSSWAHCTGRPTASLITFLLERAIHEALRNNEVPQPAVDDMNKLIHSLAHD